jgi:hypothetical protein
MFYTTHSSRRKSDAAALPALALTLLLSAISGQAHAADTFGSYAKPYAATSYWNSMPVAPVLGNSGIPTSQYYPLVGESSSSTGVFQAKSTDGPVVVTSDDGGPWDPDSGTRHDVTIPHWPADTKPAAGGDGHADIIDPIAGVVYSFWLLKYDQGRWKAEQVTWSKLDGGGWPDPAHYYQGSRAAGVASSAGLIRTAEMSDGQPYFHHALTMSMTNNGLSAKPTYIFPATSADGNAATTNTGPFPEGGLMMLPASFDAQALSNPMLRRVAETLKRYGAYVTDRNYGTPYEIYAEIGSGFDLNKNGWDQAAANDLEKMRVAMRQVVSVGGWVDGNGATFTPDNNLNILSMRGKWQAQSSMPVAPFDTMQQGVVFPAAPTQAVQMNNWNQGLPVTTWGIPAPGTKMRVTAVTTGGGKFRLRATNGSGTLFDTNNMDNGQYVDIAWPGPGTSYWLYATSAVNQVSSVSVTVKKAP